MRNFFLALVALTLPLFIHADPTIPIAFSITADSDHKAELYCHQALGANARVTMIRSATSEVSISHNHTLSIHHSTVRCSRLLDLEDFDVTTGLYLDHALWVLTTFPGQSTEEHDHQLFRNTLEILAQIGAPAIGRLWDEYVNIEDDSLRESSSFLTALSQIVESNSTTDALDEVVKILSRFDPFFQSERSEHNHFRREKSALLSKGAWPLDDLWPPFKSAINAAIADNDVEVLITLLHAYHQAVATQGGTASPELCQALAAIPADAFDAHLGAELTKALQHFSC